MGTIAKGEITLSPVNDAYTVLLTPASCVINADFDGSNPKLQNATTTLIIKRGTKTVPFNILEVTKSSADVGVSFSTATTLSASLKLLGVSKNDLSGWFDITFRTQDGFDYTSTVRFNFTIVRESSMLDWILDWEGSKTKIGSTYIMTPKLFVGNKEKVAHPIEEEDADGYKEVYEWTENAITGVYIGPDLIGDKQTVGLYGYYCSEEIFHLNAEGGMIGGWTINKAGLASGNIKILSEGTIEAGTATETFWGLYANGNATFAKGNVTFNANGDASFKGSITSASGNIGGWKIVPTQLYSGRIILDSDKGLIGVYAGLLAISAITGEVSASTVPSDGGVVMYYTSSADFGLIGYSTTAKVFQIGSTNYIAGWNFDHQAIYTGTKNISQHAFTAENSLTISPTGIRSNKWYIDRDGTAQFVGGSVKFNVDSGEMFGWSLKSDRISNQHVALVSDSSISGLYISVADITEISSHSLRGTIGKNGGIFMFADNANGMMEGRDTNGNLCFALRTNGYNQIGKWYFNHNSIYIGSDTLSPQGFSQTSGSMVLSTDVIAGFQWKFNADGSGAVAGGNISWDEEGNVTFAESVTLNWANISNAIGNKLTKIDANGIYTGTISADKITAGTITTAAIKNGDYWALNIDGSGYLAHKNISWKADGTLYVNKGFIGGWELTQSYLGAAAVLGMDSDGYPKVTTDGVYGLSMYNDFICFNHSDGRQAIFGTWDNLGHPMLVRLINNKASAYDLSSKIGIYFDIANSSFNENYAFCGRGNGVLNGAIDGYAFKKITMSSANTVYNQYMNTAEANRFIVKATADRTYLTLPTISQVRRLLGVGNSTPFCVRLTIICDIGSNNFILLGRSTQSVNNGETPYNNDSYPVIVHWNGSHWENKEMAQGDSLEFLLVYDPDQTETLNGWPTKYSARIINIQS